MHYGNVQMTKFSWSHLFNKPKIILYKNKWSVLTKLLGIKNLITKFVVDANTKKL